MPRPTLSIIVVTYNSAETIAQCLATIPAAGAGLPSETIVVDTGSHDGTVARVRGMTDVAVVESTNRGFGVAANLGARRAVGEILVFLNPDCVLPRDSLAPLSAHLRTRGVGAASGLLVDRAGRPEPFGEPFPSFPWYVRRRFPQRSTVNSQLSTPFSVPWLSGALLVVRAAAFHAVGGFAETFFLYYEDVDLCRRLRAAGYTLLLDPTVRVLHAGGHSAALGTRLRASDHAEDAYFARYRPRWESQAIRWIRRPLRRQLVLPLGGAGAIGIVLGLLPHALPAALVASGAWFAGVLIARVPDLGTVLLLGSIILGQVVRLPLGPGITVTDAVLPLALAGWGVAALRGGWVPAPHRARGTLAALALVAGAVLPGLLLAFERLSLTDWRSAAAYSVRLLLLLALVPLGARVLRRPWLVPRGLILAAAVTASLGLVQVWVVPSVPAAITSPVGQWLVAALPGLVDVEGWDPHPGRLFSTWLDPNLLGGLFLLALAVLLAAPPPARRVAATAAGAVALAVTGALVLTKSRTTLGALLVLLGAQALLIRSRRRLVPLITAGALSLMFVPSFAARLGSLGTADPTVLLRLQSWQNALTQSAAAPLFGVGYNAYGAEQLARGNIGSLAIHSRSGADSSTLTFLATTGLWGSGLLSGGWVLLLWFLLRRARARGNWIAGAAGLGLIGLTAHAQFVHSLVYIHLAVPLALLVGAALAAERQGEQEERTAGVVAV